MTNLQDSKSCEPFGCTRDITLEAQRIALSKIFMPEGISKKYNFVINKETKESTIEKKN